MSHCGPHSIYKLAQDHLRFLEPKRPPLRTGLTTTPLTVREPVGGFELYALEYEFKSARTFSKEEQNFGCTASEEQAP